MIEPSFPRLSVGLKNQLLQIMGRSGKIEAMMKVPLNFFNIWWLNVHTTLRLIFYLFKSAHCKFTQATPPFFLFLLKSCILNNMQISSATFDYLYVFTAVIFNSLSLSLSASHRTVVLQDSCIQWWYQLWYLLNFVEKSFVSWKLEEIYWGNLQVQFPFSTFLKLCIKSLHLATFLSHTNDMMAKNPSIFKSYWGNT